MRRVLSYMRRTSWLTSPAHEPLAATSFYLRSKRWLMPPIMCSSIIGHQIFMSQQLAEAAILEIQQIHISCNLLICWWWWICSRSSTRTSHRGGGVEIYTLIRDHLIIPGAAALLALSVYTSFVRSLDLPDNNFLGRFPASIPFLRGYLHGATA